MTEKDIKDLFGYNLKRIRKDKKLSQMDLANQLDMHFTFISDIENGKKWVSPETIAKIATLLHIEPFQLFRPKEFEPIRNPSLVAFVNDLDNAICNIKANYSLNLVWFVNFLFHNFTFL